ncbi:MAG: VIT and VWA domain-containing protein [Gammaproteobacteria bacterium]|nr:VIT and VWA domain-containing protein [Gammaproteobacteria bacterium]MDH5799299.1 VIT and VWA domain-containing protein [Gammaproteobacteria bacterium]
MKLFNSFIIKSYRLFLRLTLSFCIIGSSQAAGLLTPKNNHLGELKIKDHEVNVIIEDGYAITRIEQVFHNPHTQDLEAIYAFPVPEQASVGEFTLWIDGKPITGEVLEKKQARQIYETEKAAGRDSGITEKNGYKTFEISVNPVRAGQDTRIRLVYIQPAHIDTGIGRYVYPLEEGGVDEAALNFWNNNDKVENTFKFNLQLKSAYPVKGLRLPNQPLAQVSQNAKGEWEVAMRSQAQTTLNTTANEEQPNTHVANTSQIVSTEVNPKNRTAYTLNKDIVVYWRLQDGLPGSIDLVTQKPKANGRGTFMLTVTPGDDLDPITQGTDWVFVLDISGSMQGKYATLAEGVNQALKKMRTQDRFRIVTFNNSASEISTGYVAATPENLRYYTDKVKNVKPGGGTNLFAGIALGMQAIDSDRPTGIVLVTDGVANVGETEQKKFIELVKKQDMRIFTFIMGNSANRPLLQAVTKASGGFADNVSNSDDIVGKIILATSKMTHKAMHGMEVNIAGVKTADITPAQIGSLYRGQQLVLFGHYWGNGQAHVQIKSKISGQQKIYESRFPFPATANDNPEIERLWAFARIEDLNEEIQDFGEKADIKQAIVDLATEFGLVTDYTSMVTMREESFTAHGIDRSNKRRVEMEHQAQQQRRQQTARSRRVDQQQPAFTAPRAGTGRSSGGGSGGAMGIWTLLLLPLLALRRKRT